MLRGGTIPQRDMLERLVPLVAVLEGVRSESQAECVLRHFRSSASSEQSEDFLLLPTLLSATRGGPGVFVELGALDGRQYSNTIVLEQCFNWRGVLVEANPSNFARLLQSRRRAVCIHSAVCAEANVSINVTIDGGVMAVVPTLFSASVAEQRKKKGCERIRKSKQNTCSHRIASAMFPSCISVS